MSLTRLGAAGAEEVPHRLVVGIQAPEFLLFLAPRAIFREEIEPLLLVIFLEGMVLAGESDRVARILERLDEGVLGGGDFAFLLVVKAPVLGGVFSREETGATRTAEHRHGEGVLEFRPLLRQRVDMGRFHDGIAIAAQGIPSLIIGHDDDDIGTVGSPPFGCV